MTKRTQEKQVLKGTNDPIADLLTRIRNGGMAQKRYVEVSFSKIKQNIIDLLKEEGFIQHSMMKETPVPGVIRVYLKYNRQKKHVINGLKRLSTPGRSLYATVDDIPKIFGGMGNAILSTSKGVMTGKKAKELHVGGKLLCAVW